MESLLKAVFTERNFVKCVIPMIAIGLFQDLCMKLYPSARLPLQASMLFGALVLSWVFIPHISIMFTRWHKLDEFLAYSLLTFGFLGLFLSQAGQPWHSISKAWSIGAIAWAIHMFSSSEPPPKSA